MGGAAMSSILVNPKRLKALENEVEDLEMNLRILESELKSSDASHDEADKALIEMWSCVPKEKRRELIESNEYIGEMFWNERDM